MIELRNVNKHFGSLKAIDDLSLEIGPGELFGFIGPNGAGKSTTMKVLACLLRPDSGTAKVCGFDCNKQGDEIRRVLGYMPDFLGFYDDLTVDEYLQFFGAAFGLPRKQRRATIDGVLELTDLTAKRDAMVNSLSRGMQQRLGVARVLMHDPKVLLLDEPASGLDPRARIEMRSLLTELSRMGKCLMVSSHILTELGEMSTSIGIIEQGKLLYSGSLSEALARSRTIGAVGDRVIIVLEEGGAPIESAHAAINVLDRVATVEIRPATRELDVTLTPGDHGHHFLIEALVAAGARIAAFKPQAVRLEDAFLKLTTGALQ